MLTPDDAIAALRMLRKWRPWALPALLSITTFVILAVGVAFTGFGLITTGMPIALGVITLALLVMAMDARRSFARTWNSHPENLQPITWTFHEDGLLIETTNSKYSHAWSAFLYAKATGKLIVVAQQGEGMINFFPRRLFDSDVDWQTVQDLLARKLPWR